MILPDNQKQTGRILLGMSGGVDSSVAAFLLQQQGWDVLGITLITHDHAAASLADAKAVAEQLGIRWQAIDVRDIFCEIVIEDFITSYTQGRTPNPCVVCNPLIKFKTLCDLAGQFECKAVATGHYAEIRRLANGRLALAKSQSGIKDQSYFMYRLTQEQLEYLVFPLSGRKKPEIRAIAAQAGLKAPGGDLAQKPDSQDCCFIPEGNYTDYISQALNRPGFEEAEKLTKTGNVVNTSGRIIGTHKGLIHYTIGQRKGFDVQTTDRLFVVDRDLQSNTLVVGPYADVLQDEIRVIDPVYSGIEKITAGERMDARIRNSAAEVPCTVYPSESDEIRVIFDQPIAAPAPGQSCVFYRNGLIMAGGFITM